MYLRAPKAKWYLILGCDNYVHADYMLRRLEEYDHTKPYWLAQFSNPSEKVPAFIDLARYPLYQKLPDSLKKDRKFEWTSGGIGWFMSNALAKDYAENIEPFMEYIPPFKICYCPDKITGMLFSLRGYTITTFAAHWQNTMLAYSPDGWAMANQAMDRDEFMIYHYMTPRKLLAADQRVVHEKLDRMVNAGAAQDIVEYFRKFIDVHFEILRRKQTEIKYVSSLQTKERHGFHDIPHELTELENTVSNHDHKATVAGK